MLTFKIPSGIDQVDRIWEGLYRGAAYLLFGRAQYGRNLIALHLARTGVERGETCIYVSGRRPRELAIQAESLGFDVDQAIRAGKLRLLRIPSAVVDGTDPHAAQDALGALADFVSSAAPERLVIEDFSPFTRTPNPNLLAATARAFTEHVCRDQTTAILGLGEPGNQRTREAVTTLRSLTAGAIHLDNDAEAGEDSSLRKLTMLPLVGSIHPRQRASLDLESLVKKMPARVSADELSSGDGTGDLPRFGEPQLKTSAEVHQLAGGDSGPAEFQLQEDYADAAQEIAGDGEMASSPIRFFDVDGEWDQEPEAAVADVSAEAGIEGDGFSGDGASPASKVSVNPMSSIFGVSAEGLTTTEQDEQSENGALPSELSREDFAWAFDRARAEWSDEGHSFLALAARLDVRHAAAKAVPPLVTLLRAVAGENAVMTADDDGNRVALLVQGAGAESAKTLLGRLREELFAAGPAIGEGALSAVATLILPNGDPFPMGSAFLSHVFEGE